MPKSAKPENGPERDSANSEIQRVVEQVEKHAQAFQKAVRQTVDKAWELGDALRSAKKVIAHGHWNLWLERMGLHPRLAQRCMRLRKLYPEKRQVC